MAVKKGALSPDQPTLSQGTTVAKKADVPVPHDIEWGFDIQGILGSTRKVRGTFHVPKTDKDNEIITAGAMDNAMEDYMHLPIISEYHKERPIGIVLKSWKTADGKYQFEGVFKSTADCDDVWEKVQKGEYDMLSIAGKRTEASEECSTHPLLRSQGRPCVTKGLRLDSISACDEGARNDETSLEMAKANAELDPYLCTTALDLTQVKDTLIKGTDSNSPLVHQTFDGTRKRTDQMPKKCSGKPPELQKSEEEMSESEKKKKEEDEETEEKKADGEPDEDEEKKAGMGDGMGGEILKAIHEMNDTLKLLVASDKEVHSKIGKADEPRIIGPVQKAEEKPKDEANTVTKAALIDPAEFKKAMDTIAEMDAKIKALEALPAVKNVVIIQKAVEDDDVLESDATAIIKSTKEGKKK